MNKWTMPGRHFLDKSPPVNATSDLTRDEVTQAFRQYDVNVVAVAQKTGPTVETFHLALIGATKVSTVAKTVPDVGLLLGISNLKFAGQVPNTKLLAIEVPRIERGTVTLEHMMSTGHWMDKDIPIPIGKSSTGQPIICDFAEFPHLLVGGSTGSGKSVFVNSFILSVLCLKSPDKVRFIMIDPKQLEFMPYAGIPHLLHPIITDNKQAIESLKWLVGLMNHRYTLLAKARVRNIGEFNTPERGGIMPRIVVLIDEFADLILSDKTVEKPVAQLGQKARAAGIHLLIATQRPDMRVVTGLIKANLDARVALKVASAINSRIILDTEGAESLIGKGDLLFRTPTANVRAQAAYVSMTEIVDVVSHWRRQVTPLTRLLNWFRG